MSNMHSMFTRKMTIRGTRAPRPSKCTRKYEYLFLLRLNVYQQKFECCILFVYVCVCFGTSVLFWRKIESTTRSKCTVECDLLHAIYMRPCDIQIFVQV